MATIMPRVQRSRRKGARTPAGAIYVGRPTRWGNPFMTARFGHMKSVTLHARWLRHDLGALSLERLGFCPSEIDTLRRQRAYVLANLHRLAGHSLCCWCPANSPCHADTLAQMAITAAEIEGIAA